MLKEINSSKDVITNVDLFNEIIELVKNSKDTALMKCEGELPPFVDYAIPESYVSGIYDCEFDPLFVLSPGYNEGYYLDLSIRGAWSITDKIDTLHLGTIKTLAESVEGIRQMAALYGECLVSFQKIMYDNMDSFTRKGFEKPLKPIISHGVMRMDRSTKEILSTRKTYLRSLFMRIIPKRNWQHLILNSQRLLKF